MIKFTYEYTDYNTENKFTNIALWQVPISSDTFVQFVDF